MVVYSSTGARNITSTLIKAAKTPFSHKHTHTQTAKISEEGSYGQSEIEKQARAGLSVGTNGQTQTLKPGLKTENSNKNRPGSSLQVAFVH